MIDNIALPRMVFFSLEIVLLRNSKNKDMIVLIAVVAFIRYFFCLQEQIVMLAPWQ